MRADLTDPAAVSDLAVALADRIRAAPARDGSVRLVGIDGRSGAGKSTIADAVALVLGAQIVRLDDLIPGWSALALGPVIADRELREALAQGRAGSYRRFDWVRMGYAETVEVPAAGEVVIEGCGAGTPPLATHLSFLIWVEADRAARRRRGLGRDGAAYEPHWLAWERQEDEVYAGDDPRRRADIVIETS